MKHGTVYLTHLCSNALVYGEESHRFTCHPHMHSQHAVGLSHPAGIPCSWFDLPWICGGLAVQQFVIT